MPTQLDEIDRRILRALQRDGRQQNTELAQEVGLSPSPCLRRVRLLEDAGVIERYVAVLNAAKVGIGMTLFTRVWLTAQDADTIEHFIEAMKRLPQVMECYIMLGESDALLRVVVEDLDGYRQFQTRHLTRANGIQNVKTDLPSQIVKQSYALPL
ncbi:MULTISPECIES: Lrp/AsnC family transcriptional regulator [unclassified Lysobacter]|uniref:Lrp/AsnC family transcriptional regulator n=1 Tax=unclassified Lysobacter TaxID=2635362 RepID=UPI001BE95D68|nr:MULTISPECIES: Lrp/AsnC family transcriptional regulator [unclassified Lysobacter]MBT2744779.1 Lrp/AsnC family transcriptional regulator [Lysobacter sp. ISL-42]MBT2752228.1 Lrp/AsnC family transcriptional regulator [Lysobacter sp. ISL-50]MBT2778725.1 Lrp/AsnC family transcriptional regulator [Lysobacter sp. ISL-54]MBT2780344.1 Lrp/AsnC family transcriptional regulator [Lysobacter sp. ISL-52]